MDYTGLTDDELLSRRHRAFLRLATAPGSSDAGRASAYDEIKLINRELESTWTCRSRRLRGRMTSEA